MTIPNNLGATTQLNLEQLITDQVCEGAHLDFKRDYPNAWTDALKHEFLADVTAFANAGGGDLIFGINENGHAQAAAVVPQVVGNADQEVRRLQDFLLNLVEPRLPGVQVFAVPVNVSGVAGHVFIVRVPQSWVGPHRVRTNQHFFIRDGLRKRQLDVPEIRNLFLRTDSQAKQVRDFRSDRLSKLLAGEAPSRLFNAPLLVVHFVPTQSALGLIQIDPVIYSNQRQLPVFGGTGGFSRINLDGALAIRNETAQGETHGYSLLFRNGFFESTYVISDWARGGVHFVLPSLSYEQHLIRLLTGFRNELLYHGVESGCSIMLSLLRADEVQLGVRTDLEMLDRNQTFFDRKVVVLPDVLAAQDDEPENALKPVFDLFWQAAGFERSRNYDAAGLWAPRN